MILSYEIRDNKITTICIKRIENGQYHVIYHWISKDYK